MIFLAIRYLLGKKRQTLLTLLGVFFGTTAYVAVSGFFIGFQNFMVEQLVNNNAQVYIQARQDFLTEHQLDKDFFGDSADHVFWVSPPAGVQGYLGVQSPESWYERLKADPRAEAYSPLLTVPALFSLRNINVSASLTGCNPEQQAKVTSVAKYMTHGNFRDIAGGGNRIIVGEELMRRLGVGLNQFVQVSVSAGKMTPFKVIGTFSTGNRMMDLQAYGSLKDIQGLNRTPNLVNQIAVRLKDYRISAAVATGWNAIAPEKTESWDQQNAGILSVFTIQTALRFAMILTVLIVAGFGMYNILNITVNQKRQDIAILHSMGYDNIDVIFLFFVQGLIVGVIGAALGLISGYLVCLYLQSVPFMEATPANPSGNLMISITLSIYIQAASVAILSVCIASILPARAAGKLTPIDIIRSGG